MQDLHCVLLKMIDVLEIASPQVKVMARSLVSPSTLVQEYLFLRVMDRRYPDGPRASFQDTKVTLRLEIYQTITHDSCLLGATLKCTPMLPGTTKPKLPSASCLDRPLTHGFTYLTACGDNVDLPQAFPGCPDPSQAGFRLPRSQLK
jgi:hypothetical protein